MLLNSARQVLIPLLVDDPLRDVNFIIHMDLRIHSVLIPLLVDDPLRANIHESELNFDWGLNPSFSG